MNYSHINLFCFTIFAVLLYSLQVNGQNISLQSINTSGDRIVGNSGSVSYSIGQVFYSYLEDDTHQATEGIQQVNPNSIEDSNSPEDSDMPDDITQAFVKASVYPNPTIDYVTLTTEGFNFNSSLNSYQLYTYQGKLLSQNIIENQNTQIDLTYLSSSIYILQVFAEQKLLKTFKILKQ